MSSVIIFFSFMLLTSLTSVFGVSINGMAINRIFYSMPVALARTSINYYQQDGVFNPYYYQSTLENNVKNYLSSNLKGYVDSYKIDFIYYRQLSNGEYSFEPSIYPRKVEIYFSCNYSKFVNFEGRRGFEIERTNNI